MAAAAKAAASAAEAATAATKASKAAADAANAAGRLCDAVGDAAEAATAASVAAAAAANWATRAAADAAAAAASHKRPAEEDTYDYANGPTFTRRMDVTTDTIVQLVDQLTERFGSEYKFVPEAVVEGGILMESWPGKGAGAYKTFRFHVPESPLAAWPRIEPGTLDGWRLEEDVPPEVIWPVRVTERFGRAVEMRLFMKACNAPRWTKKELRLVIDSFEGARFQLVREKREKRPAVVHLDGDETPPTD
jgi:hypothetical protein